MNREASQDQILRDLFRLLRRQAPLIIACMLVAVGAGIAYSLLKTPVYEATATIQFTDQTRDLNALGTPAFPSQNPAQGAAADAEVITSNQVVSGVDRSVDTDLSKDDIRGSVQATVDPDSNLVTIQATADDADLAAALANAFARQTKQVVTKTEVSRLHDTISRLQDSIKDEPEGSPTRTINLDRISQLRSLAAFARPVSITDPARAPSSASSPKPVRDTILAAILGLILGVLAACLRDSLDRRLTDAHDVQHNLGVPMLGYVEADALGRVGFSTNGGSAEDDDRMVEPFRILRSNLEFLSPDSRIKTVAITSPVAQEGKSTVASGLATAAALAGKSALLVECDLRRPVFSERFKIPAQPGLTDWVAGKAKPAEVLRQVQVHRDAPTKAQGATAIELDEASGAPRALNLITAGSWPPRPTELLGSERFAGFLENVSKLYDLVICDCAPLLPVGDTLEIIPLVDAALICIRLDQTTHEQALAAKAAIEHFPARPTGVVVTGVRPGREGYYYGYYSSPPPPVAASPGERG
jgi:Mrp family chromosome partitioning ATPase/capsular polysaccharide biosynthesis protein